MRQASAMRRHRGRRRPAGAALLAWRATALLAWRATALLAWRATALLAVAACAAAGCDREVRRLQQPPAPLRSDVPRAHGLVPGPAASGPAPAASATPARYDETSAWAVAQGKRWYRWYNCNGCHAWGGGGMGPPLLDASWRYGHEPEQIAQTILQGRPNGMPSFAGRIPDDQLWQIVAYVRSMSAQLRSDVLPGRSDGLSAGEPEVRRDPQPPVKGP